MLIQQNSLIAVWVWLYLSTGCVQVLNERILKDADLTATRLTKAQADFENQVMAADAMAAENQARVAELKVGIVTCVCCNFLRPF